ncbi:MAG: 5-methyltetrahydropteroyltriglutamate--homocysteine methyltransferase [Halanaeroarchaeum sp.]
MSELVGTTLGLYPLPDRSKETLSDLKGHQKGDLVDGDESDEVLSAYAEARAAVIDEQRDAGLDRIVEGQLRWDDMLAHPLAVHDSVETRGIVRYYDNNNFYRDPAVVGDLAFDGDVAAELERGFVDDEPVDPSRRQAVLPGPYTLADLATDEYYDDEAEFLDAVGTFLAGEAGAFPDVETLFLLEPSLATNPPGDGEDARASEAIDAVATALDADVVVFPYWDALEEKVYAHLLDADVDAVGFDFVTEQTDHTYLINEYGTTDDVALGLIDGENTLVETPEAIRERVEWVQDRTPVADFDRIYVAPNTGLFYLPSDTFVEKLGVLGDVTARQEVSA